MSGTSPSTSYVIASSRTEAIQKMVLSDPILSKLYNDGPKKDGKAGWVNAIKDQSGSAYRLLLYIIKLPLANQYADRVEYEVLFGPITEDGPPNFPRTLYTMAGAINLMRDGLPSERFALDLLHSKLEIVPYDLGKDLKIEHYRRNGCGYICVYDKAGQGIRVLDLNDYYEIYEDRKCNEIQVRSADEVILGDTEFVKPFLIRYASLLTDESKLSPAQIAKQQLGDR